MLSFFPRGVLDEVLNLIESVSEDFPSYSCKRENKEETEKEKKSTPDFERHLSASVGAQPFFYPMMSLTFRSGYPPLYRPPVSPRRGSGRPGQRYTGAGFTGCFKCGDLSHYQAFCDKK